MDVSPDASPATTPATSMDRRHFAKLGVAAAAMVGVPLTFSGTAGANPGTLGAPNADGLRLLPGFTSRIVAQTGQTVGPTSHVWHGAPDGGACFPKVDGGWIYVSNSELSGGTGGAGLVNFAPNGSIVGARTLLSGTSRNCGGGATPWKTWLSCEEVNRGRVFETYPLANKSPVFRPRLGRFKHEAVAVDAQRKWIYLTEDETDGCLYRYRGKGTWTNLRAGRLMVLSKRPNGTHDWFRIPDPAATSTPTRYQRPAAVHFNGGEGIVVTGGYVYFATKGSNRIWRLNPTNSSLYLHYDDDTAVNAVATGVDNLTANAASSVFIAEDGGNMQVVVARQDGQVFPVVEVVGTTGSEITGPAFNPAGDRMYFSSQRNPGRTYEIRGPLANL
jgi:secreted PhoX family phosphatase